MTGTEKYAVLETMNSAADSFYLHARRAMNDKICNALITAYVVKEVRMRRCIKIVEAEHVTTFPNVAVQTH